MSVTASFDESNGLFKRLSESKAISTSSAGRNYAVSSNIALHKFLLEKWGFSMPLALSYRNNLQKPRFAYFANDLVISGDELDKQSTKSVMNSYSLSLSKSNSRNWFVKNTLDKLTLEHTQSNSRSRTALAADTSRLTTYRGNYRLDPKVSFRLLGQTFSVLPQTIALNALYTENLVRSYFRTSPDSTFDFSTTGSQFRKTLNPSFNVAYAPHRTTNASFDFSQNRDSVGTRGDFGEEVSRTQTLNSSFSEDLKLFRPRLSYNASYTEDHRFEIRREEDFRNVSNNARYGVDGTVSLQRIVRLLTRIRDETKDSLAAVGSPAWFARQVESFVEKIQDPSVGWSRQRSSNYLSVRRRPDLDYQFGLVDTLPAEDVSANSYPGRGQTDAFNASSGLKMKVLTVAAAYNESVNKSYAYGNIETRTHSTSYPNANVRVTRLEAIPLLKKYARTSSITTAFNQTYEERYQDSTLQSDSKTMSLSPAVSWQTNWVIGLSSTVDVSYTETVGKTYQGVFEVPSRSLSRGVSVSLAYTFSAPRGLSLPLLGGIRFASNMAVNLTVSGNRNTNYSSDLTVPIYDSSVLQADLGLSYNFSSSITGGANLSYLQNKETIRDQDTKRVGVNVWTNINF